jgi:hypothetical protein
VSGGVTLSTRRLYVGALIGLSTLILTCQGYPFVLQVNKRVAARNYESNVGVSEKTDILFVIDNSGSMTEEQAELRANMAEFINVLSLSANDYSVGILSTDIARRPSASGSCEPCCDVDTNDDGAPDWSDCDAGRLYAFDDNSRVLTRPLFVTADTEDNSINEDEVTFAEDERDEVLAALVTKFNNAVTSLGTQGSAFEAPLESMRRALDPTIDPTAYYLNRNFIREDAALAIIFLTDEDDCSFPDAWYDAPQRHDAQCYYDGGRCSNQAKSCAIDSECNDGDNSTIDTCLLQGSWLKQSGYCEFTNADTSTDTDTCVRANSVDTYIDFLINLKGGRLEAIRAGGILGGVPSQVIGSVKADSLGPDTSTSTNTATSTDTQVSLAAVPDEDSLNFTASGCYSINNSLEGRAGSPSDGCGCWDSVHKADTRPGTKSAIDTTADTMRGDDFYCNLMSEPPFNQSVDRVPQTTQNQGGCRALPSSRLVTFLDNLRDRRVKAGLSPGVIADSICNQSYGLALQNIATTVVLSDCFGLEERPEDANSIRVERNGVVLLRVENGSTTEGWSYDEERNAICLEGGLAKEVQDRFVITVITETKGFEKSTQTSTSTD